MRPKIVQNQYFSSKISAIDGDKHEETKKRIKKSKTRQKHTHKKKTKNTPKPQKKIDTAKKNEINKTKAHNVITIEDPVEFIHNDEQSIISHREVGKQTESFANALRAALREDPDVILVGELRDLETVSLAITAAETGHLVFGTLHTSGAPATINRIIDVFPPDQQEQVRAQISNSLKMVVTQRLLKTKDGLARCAAFEIMKCTAPIQNLIREAKIHQIPSVMQTSVRDGMITMDKALEALIQNGKVDPGEAKSGN